MSILELSGSAQIPLRHRSCGQLLLQTEEKKTQMGVGDGTEPEPGSENPLDTVLGRMKPEQQARPSAQEMQQDQVLESEQNVEIQQEEGSAPLTAENVTTAV